MFIRRRFVTHGPSQAERDCAGAVVVGLPDDGVHRPGFICGDSGLTVDLHQAALRIQAAITAYFIMVPKPSFIDR